jgi:hypothetical protein
MLCASLSFKTLTILGTLKDTGFTPKTEAFVLLTIGLQGIKTDISINN